MNRPTVEAPPLDVACIRNCHSTQEKGHKGCVRQKNKDCPTHCSVSCKRQPCQTTGCISKCNNGCSSICTLMVKKHCFLDHKDDFKKCLWKCPGMTHEAKMAFLNDVLKRQVGKISKCKMGCITDSRKCNKNESRQCGNQCRNICTRSKCLTQPCRVLCSSKCTNTCIELKKQKCALLSQQRSLQCMKNCKK